MNETTSKTLRRVTLGVACTMILAATSFAATKAATEQCSIAVVAHNIDASTRVCDLNTVKNLAAHGHTFEQNQMGIASVLHISPEYSVKDAVDWFQKAAQKGYAPAQVNLGVMYVNGWGVEKNYARALYWFRRAAEESSFPRANYNLGILYMNGQGVTQDNQAARKFFETASAAGDSSAQTNLA